VEGKEPRVGRDALMPFQTNEKKARLGLGPNNSLVGLS
jgi:hypothetical protein